MDKSVARRVELQVAKKPYMVCWRLVGEDWSVSHCTDLEDALRVFQIAKTLHPLELYLSLKANMTYEISFDVSVSST